MNRRVLVHRTARVAAGVTGVLFAAAIVFCLWRRPASPPHDQAAVRLLLASWPVMAAVYALAAVVSGLLVRRDVVPRASCLAAGSYTWPLLAITLFAPHTLQLPFVATATAVAVLGYLPMQAIRRRETAALEDRPSSTPWALSTTWTAGPGT